ncbi:cAMP-binding domain of CRP or a regulatory subunit of cAMP-dependent protein kinases [Chitinophaga filiformis]|uniref:cAMP-binding domain of CRP or a regulatory subunit of cAMP-dependent protein kinases n=2 Tax=Chitinophaga filiformis TaxID=104663 RepID=A0A1G7I9L5_CHIFI|nr:cAMP-binding domain of CRP or a regulatory subunit of cAMP-dependent protein kinases [Chitinophaga filiformis]
MEKQGTENHLQSFRKTMERIIPISDTDWQMISQKFEPIEVPKRTLLTKEGQIASSIYFIIKGILRIFYTKEDVEITGFIFSEGLFASCYESFLLQTKSNQTLEALEDCVLLTIDYHTLQTLYKEVPALHIVGRVVAEQRFINGQRILSSHLLDSHEERYRQFADQYPDLLQRVPQHIIASYLGITPVSLSRIRKRISRK